jgi:hypothetical protein
VISCGYGKPPVNLRSVGSSQGRVTERPTSSIRPHIVSVCWTFSIDISPVGEVVAVESVFENTYHEVTKALESI